MCNTITPVIGYRHVLMRVYLTPPGRKSDRWINMSHFDERTRNTMRDWIHSSEEVQLRVLVDAEEAEYFLGSEVNINGECTTNSESR